MPTVPTIVASVALASCTLATRPPSTEPTRQEGACCDLYPAASGDLVIEVAAESPAPTLAEVARSYAEITGQHLVLDAETLSLLETGSCGVQDSVTVPAAEVQSFFEQLLVANDYALHTLRGAAPRLVVIESLRTQARNTVRDSAVIVPSEKLQHLATHPATLVSTVVHLPNTDVRQLSNSMRTLITDANTQQMLPAGNTNAVVLTGFGSQVARFADMLRTIDANSVQEDSRKLAVLRLQRANAWEVATELETVLGVRRAGKSQGDETLPLPPPRVRITADERTNSLVVSADPQTMTEIERLVQELDAEVK